MAFILIVCNFIEKRFSRSQGYTLYVHALMFFCSYSLHDKIMQLKQHNHKDVLIAAKTKQPIHLELLKMHEILCISQQYPSCYPTRHLQQRSKTERGKICVHNIKKNVPFFLFHMLLLKMSTFFQMKLLKEKTPFFFKSVGFEIEKIKN